MFDRKKVAYSVALLVGPDPSNAVCGKSKRKARGFELKYSALLVSASIGGQPRKTKEGDLQSPFGSHPHPYYCPIFIFALMHICILILLLALLTSRKYRFSLLRRPFDKTTPAQPWTPLGKYRFVLKINQCKFWEQIELNCCSFQEEDEIYQGRDRPAVRNYHEI